MKYLLDTDWVIDCLTDQPHTRHLLPMLATEGVGISVITYSEIYEGIYTGRNPEQAEKGFKAFLRGVKVLGIGPAIARENASIRGELRRKKRPIEHRAFDILIAATTITHHLLLVTNNTKDYEDIFQLSLYPLSSQKVA